MCVRERERERDGEKERIIQHSKQSEGSIWAPMVHLHKTAVQQLSDGPTLTIVLVQESDWLEKWLTFC